MAIKLKKIDVNKQLPLKNGLYIVFLNGSMHQRNYFKVETKQWFSFIEKAETTKYVTHWVESKK